ncbi:CPBP family intramembrane glutamic endopeptidase [Enterococcus hermanniensis]|uniref:ABC transporter permease n=1 Tax=Enterococcus hermanniensis TaxID=249189 RepID=A0A1L8TM82_9ENTE|nr:type II CAAX endopeptidase family protein [Enterococcus hermanniensis]OJG45268.1 ABC transporter permease [Enterococcus hermanniensis]
MSEIKISKTKSLIAILIPIVELLIGDLITPHIAGQWGKVLFTVVLFFVGFCVAIYLYYDVLKKDGQIFKQHLWRNLLLAVLGVLFSYIILALVRQGLSLLQVSSPDPETSLLSIQTASLGLVGSLTALMAPFSEEIIFRHVLFYQWRNRGIVTWLMFILSSVLFGLAHWNNFDGQLIQMIPYMFIGAWFALIYYFSKNIWQNIMTHFFFDCLQFLAAIIVLIVSFFQG